MNWDDAVGDNLGVELHDSKLVEVIEADGEVILRLSPAWLFRSEGEPGRDEGTVWNRDAILRFGSARISGYVPPFPGWITDGNLRSPDSLMENMISVPLEIFGPVEMTLAFDRPDLMKITGSTFRIELDGEPSFIDVWTSL